MSAYRSLRFDRFQRSALTWSGLTFSLIAAISVGAWYMTSRQVDQAAHERFRFQTDQTRAEVRRRLQTYEQVLRAARAHMVARGAPDRDQWRAYVEHLDMARHFPGIQAVSYSPFVHDQQIGDFIASQRNEGFARFDVRPSGQRANMAPVQFIEPFDWRNQRAHGFDLWSEPTRREALERSVSSGEPTATGKIKLVQETQQNVQAGFLMCAPVFDTNNLPPSQEVRLTFVRGFVCAVFRVNDLMRGIFGHEATPYANLEIFDGRSPETASRMYDRSQVDDRVNANEGQYSSVSTFDFGGRTWSMRMTSTAIFDAETRSHMPLMLLGGGLLISILCAVLVHTAFQVRRRAHRIHRTNARLQAMTQDLRIAKMNAEAASEAKGDFLANVSHELRTPLTLILGPLQQLAICDTAPTDWKTSIQRMNRAALTLLNRVNDVLDYSKAEAGQIQVRWEHCDLRELLDPLMADVQSAAQTEGKRFQWTIDEQLGKVDVDASHLEKIAYNLIGNALKFTPPGGEIDVSLTMVDAHWYTLTVHNTGAGIARDRLGELFQRFHQIDASGTRQHSGTGIGLALVKDLVNLLGGEIDVDSDTGQGACFTVCLPRHAPEGAQVVSHVDRAQPPALNDALRRAGLVNEQTGGTVEADTSRVADSTSTHRAQVLVVDDNADMRAFIASLLNKDHVVTEAKDGLHAWALLQQRAFDVVVSDVMMPGIDGLSLTARIKADSLLSAVQVILVTARGGAQASSTGLACGADDYLAKPFAPEELMARVAAAIRTAHLQRKLCEVSHSAGRSVMAAGILHNVGNILCDIQISADIIQETLQDSNIACMPKLAQKLSMPPQKSELGEFVGHLSDQLCAERDKTLTEARRLLRSIQHASAIIRSQQDMVQTVDGNVEWVALRPLIQDALATCETRLHQSDVIAVIKDEGDIAAKVDRFKLSQILLNLINNAADALEHEPREGRRIEIQLRRHGATPVISVIDNGCGMTETQMREAFNQGYSTKGDGHGWGLHWCALWSRELGGSLHCESAGPGCGTTFSLELNEAEQHAVESGRYMTNSMAD